MLSYRSSVAGSRVSIPPSDYCAAELSRSTGDWKDGASDALGLSRSSLGWPADDACDSFYGSNSLERSRSSSGCLGEPATPIGHGDYFCRPSNSPVSSYSAPFDCLYAPSQRTLQRADACAPLVTYDCRGLTGVEAPALSHDATCIARSSSDRQSGPSASRISDSGCAEETRHSAPLHGDRANSRTIDLNQFNSLYAGMAAGSINCRNAFVAALLAQLAAADSRASRLEQQLREQRTVNEALTRQVQERDAQLQQRDGHVAALLAQLSSRQTGALAECSGQGSALASVNSVDMGPTPAGAPASQPLNSEAPGLPLPPSAPSTPLYASASSAARERSSACQDSATSSAPVLVREPEPCADAHPESAPASNSASPHLAAAQGDARSLVAAERKRTDAAHRALLVMSHQAQELSSQVKALQLRSLALAEELRDWRSAALDNHKQLMILRRSLTSLTRAARQ